MRFKLTLQRIENNVLPINYQYELSSWIYKIINFSNKKFTNFLQLKGYANSTNGYDLFTFSRLNFPANQFKIEKDRLIVNSEQFELKLSLIMSEAVEPFIIDLFQKQQFILGDKKSKVKVEVKSIERQPDPKWKETMNFITHSPIMVSKEEIKNNVTSIKFLNPNDEDYENLFFQNLLDKYITIIQYNNDFNNSFKQEAETKLKLLNKPKAKLVKINADTPEQTFTKGYDFNFKLTAPIELIKAGYYAGFGEKNSLGFGCGEAK